MTASPFPPTRLDHLPRWAAGAVLAALAGLIVLGIGCGVAPIRHFRTVSPALGGGDFALYARIVDDVRGGEGYYHAAVREQRRWDYALRPAWTVREPTLALAMAGLPDPPVRRAALAILAAGCVAAWGWRLQNQYGRPVLTAFGAVGSALGATFAFSDLAYLFHECWAGLLIALSLALYDRRRWGVSVAVGFAAVMVRELAALYPLVMLGAALIERRRGEAAAWGGALLLFFVFMVWHAGQVAGLLLPTDPGSRGWLGLNGWPFVLLVSKWNALLIGAPAAATAVAVGLMLFGAAAWPGGLGGRLFAVTAGYATTFMLVGRLDNAYWGLIVAPLMGVALAMAPQGLVDGGRRCLGGRGRLANQAQSKPTERTRNEPRPNH